MDVPSHVGIDENKLAGKAAQGTIQLNEIQYLIEPSGLKTTTKQ